MEEQTENSMAAEVDAMHRLFWLGVPQADARAICDKMRLGLVSVVVDRPPYWTLLPGTMAVAQAMSTIEQVFRPRGPGPSYNDSQA